MYKRLTKWVDGEAKENHDFDTPSGTPKEQQFTNGSRVCMEKLAAFEDAEERGRLHIAPLMDGAKVYSVMEFDPAFAQAVIKSTPYSYGVTEYELGEYGVDWFAAREEAEKALETMGGKCVTQFTATLRVKIPIK
jgi:hypothetical protein